MDLARDFHHRRNRRHVGSQTVGGFSKLVPTIVVLIGYGIAFVALAFAVKRMDVGVAYAIWAGLATAGIVLVSWFVLGNKPAATTLLGIGLIVIGVVLVNLTASVHE